MTLNRRIFRPNIAPTPPATRHLKIESDFEDTPTNRRAWAKYLLGTAAWNENMGNSSSSFGNDLTRAIARMLESSADQMEKAS